VSEIHIGYGETNSRAMILCIK